MNAATTHINIAAFHEAGHALSALNEGRQVFGLRVSTENPGSGICVHARKQRNLYDLAKNPGTANAAWLHTLKTTCSDIRICLAGPLAEAKALGKPLRSLGSRSDLDRCIRLANRLECTNSFVSEYADIDELKRVDILDSERKRVRRWLSQPRVWNAISLAAERLSTTGQLNRQNLDDLVGKAFVKEWQLCLRFESCPTVSAWLWSEDHTDACAESGVTITLGEPCDPMLSPEERSALKVNIGLAFEGVITRNWND